MEELLNISVNDALKLYFEEKDWLNWRLINKNNYHATMGAFVNCYKNRHITFYEYFNYLLNCETPSTIFIWKREKNLQNLVALSVSPQFTDNVKNFKVVTVEKRVSDSLEHKVTVFTYSLSLSDVKTLVFAQTEMILGVTKTKCFRSIMFDIVTSFNIYRQRYSLVYNDVEYAKEMVKKDFKATQENKETALYLLDSWLERNSINCQCHTTRKEYAKCQKDYMYSKEDRDSVVIKLKQYIERQ
jgi:hypothetical protein